MSDTTTVTAPAVTVADFTKPAASATKNTRGKGSRPVTYTTFPEIPESLENEAATIAENVIGYLKSSMPIADFADLVRKTADNYLFSVAVGEGVFKPLAEFFGDNADSLKSAKRMLNAQAKMYDSMNVEYEMADLVEAMLATLKAATKPADKQ